MASAKSRFRSNHSERHWQVARRLLPITAAEGADYQTLTEAGWLCGNGAAGVRDVVPAPTSSTKSGPVNGALLSGTTLTNLKAGRASVAASDNESAPSDCSHARTHKRRSGCEARNKRRRARRPLVHEEGLQGGKWVSCAVVRDVCDTIEKVTCSPFYWRATQQPTLKWKGRHGRGAIIPLLKRLCARTHAHLHICL